MKAKYINTYLVIALVAILAVLSLIATAAHANPSQFASKAATAAATTSLSYITPGTGTTTLTYDTFQVNGTNQVNNGNTFVTNSARLNIQLTASSTLTRLCRRVLYSQDNIDYYASVASVVTSATTTVESGLYNETCFTLATTSEPFLGSSTFGSRSVSLDVPTRYAKVQFYLPPGSGNGAVYAEIVPVKETK